LSRRRVVVTGLGIVSPVGSTVADAWANILAGRGGIGPITRMDVSRFSTRIGGAVKGFERERYLSDKDARKMDEFMHYGVSACADAIADSGLQIDDSNSERVATPWTGT